VPKYLNVTPTHKTNYNDTQLTKTNLYDERPTGYLAMNKLKDDYITSDNVNLLRISDLEEKLNLLDKILHGKDEEILALTNRNKILETRLKFDFNE